MSKFSNVFKKPKKKAEATVPREMAEINKQYGKLVSEAGQKQYQIYVLNLDIERINSELLTVNREAAARQELDKKAEEAKTQDKAEAV